MRDKRQLFSVDTFTFTPLCATKGAVAPLPLVTKKPWWKDGS
jgi:hypothetical protein